MEKEFSLPSTIESLREVEKIIDNLSSEINLAQDVYGNVLIAALEAANNGITHGNKLDAGKKILFKIKYEGNNLFLGVRDEGPGFDFVNLPDPTSPENIENINGRGVFLMKKLSDNLEFFENGAEVRMTFSV